MITTLIMMLQLAGIPRDTTVGFPSSKGTADNPIYVEMTTIEAIRADERTPISQKTVEKVDISKLNFGQEMPFQLSRTPSILYQSDGGSYFGYSYFRIRGIDQTRINMTLNGMPLNEPEDQGAYFSNYGDFMSSIQSFQVQRGIGISTNGVASYGGSVNMMFNNLLDTTKQVEIGWGSFNSSRLSLSLGGGITNNVGGYIKISNITSDGYRYNSGYRGLSGFGSLGYITAKDMLQFIFIFGNERSQMAWMPTAINDINRDPKTNYLVPEEKDDFSQSIYQLQYIHQFDDIGSVSIQTFYNRLNGNYIVNMSELYDFNLASEWGGASINGDLNFKPVTVYFGLHGNTYRRDHFLNMQSLEANALAPDDNIYFNSGYKREFSSFLKVMYEYGIFNLFADGQFRVVNFRYQPDRDYNINSNQITWKFFNPRFGISAAISNGVSAYSSIGMTHREPTRNDMFAGYDDLDTTNISEIGDFSKVQPEKVIDTEIGLKFTNENLFVNVNYFDMRFHNEITAIGQLSYIGLPLRKNVPESVRRGIEIDAEYRFSKYWKIYGNVAAMHSEIKEYKTDHDEVFHGVTPIMTPGWISNISVEYWNFVLCSRYVSESYLDNVNSEKIPSYFTMDLIGKIDINTYSLKLQINNIFNKRYYTGGQVNGGVPYYFVQAGINFFGTLTLGF